MVDLDKPIGLIGETPLTNSSAGEFVGVAKLEKTKSGYKIHHIDMAEIADPDILREGFSFGDTVSTVGEG
jgi:hypothetical protein